LTCLHVFSPADAVAYQQVVDKRHHSDDDDDITDDVTDDVENDERTRTSNVQRSVDENDNIVPMSSAAETDDVTDSEITSDIDESLQQCTITQSFFFLLSVERENIF